MTVLDVKIYMINGIYSSCITIMSQLRKISLSVNPSKDKCMKMLRYLFLHSNLD